MNKRHIPGFFDALARTPSFVFLCSMFLCGAAAGGLTGLHAAEGDCALELTALLRELPGQVGKSVLCAVLWLVLPPAAALFRPAALWLSGIAAARGFVLALSLAVAVAQGEGAAVLAAEALPAVISVSALLAACTLPMHWIELRCNTQPARDRYVEFISDRRRVRLETERISYLESNDSEVWIHTSTGESLRTKTKISQWEQ